jgi:photosystem II stability/assembly factor-like uncharacterized protein
MLLLAFNRGNGQTETGKQSYFERAFSDMAEEKSYELFRLSLESKRLSQGIRWDWECVGPNEMPAELNPGKDAIPGYAINRGNGTGRVNFLLVDPDNPRRVFACSPTGGLFITENGGENWHVGGTDALPVSGVASVTISRQDRNCWFITTGDGDDTFQFSDGVWRTTDGGKTWENINGTSQRRAVPITEVSWDYTRSCKILAHPYNANQVWLCTNKGLFYTRNALAPANKVRWRKVLSSFFYDIEIAPWDHQMLIACGENLFISRDGGKKWKKMPNPNIPNSAKYSFLRISAELSLADQQYIHCAVTNCDSWEGREKGEATYQRFDLEKEEWLFIRSLKSGMNNVISFRARAFTISPNDTSLLLAANIQPVYRSTDGGRTFAKIEGKQMHDDVHHLEFSPDGQTVWASHDGGVSVSYNGGLDFEDRCFGIGVANVHGLSVAQTEATHILFGGYDTGGNLGRLEREVIVDSLTGGVWDAVYHPEQMRWWHTNFGDGFETAIHPENSNIMFVTSQNGLIRRSTDGKNFDYSLKTTGWKGGWHTWFKMDPNRPQLLYLAGDKIIRSPDLGETFQDILDLDIYKGLYQEAYRLFTSEYHPGLLYAYLIPPGGEGRHKVIRTLNAWVENPEMIIWEDCPELPRDGWLGSIAVDPDNPREFFITMTGFEPQGKVYRCDANGYRDLSEGLGYCLADCMIMDHSDGSERLYVGSTYGVFTRNKYDREWTLLEGLPGVAVRSMAINRITGYIFVGTFGRGIWKAPLYTAKN